MTIKLYHIIILPSCQKKRILYHMYRGHVNGAAIFLHISSGLQRSKES